MWLSESKPYSYIMFWRKSWLFLYFQSFTLEPYMYQVMPVVFCVNRTQGRSWFLNKLEIREHPFQYLKFLHRPKKMSHPSTFFFNEVLLKVKHTTEKSGNYASYWWTETCKHNNNFSSELSAFRIRINRERDLQALLR